MPDIEPAILDFVRLNMVSGVGPRIMQRLLAQFGTAGRVLSATGSELLNVEGVGAKLSAEITKAATSPVALEEINRCQSLGIKLLGIFQPDYPQTLKEIPDPPPILYVRGEILPQDQLAVGIVGSRRCSHYGIKHAEILARGLAQRGITVISGLAKGIDAAAHKAALNAGGRTIAVMATGVDNIYPPENKSLADEILQHGAILSESPLSRPVRPEFFPQRNRIISGLSLGVIVIEATQTSGSLHTARHAYEQGREVFALPGPVDRRESEGCLALLRDGAILIRNADDVLESLGPLMHPQHVPHQPRDLFDSPITTVPQPAAVTVHSPRELTLNDQEKSILNLIHTVPRSIELVIEEAHIEISRVMATLTILEMKRFIKRLPGGEVVRQIN